MLLLLDHHHSHLSVAAINFCRSHGVVLLSFPPHYSHHLQPLDSRQLDENTPCQYVTFQVLWPKRYRLQQHRSGFECSGIWPFNPDIFTDTDFSAGFVTGRPAPSPVTPCVDELRLQSRHRTGSRVLNPPSLNRQHPAQVCRTSQECQETDPQATRIKKPVETPVHLSRSSGRKLSVLFQRLALERTPKEEAKGGELVP